MLHNRYEEVANSYPEQRPLIKSLVNSLSLSILNSKFIFQNIQLYKGIMNKFDIKLKRGPPNLGFVIFKCGKSANSKVKFEKFIIFINSQTNTNKDDYNTSFNKLWLSVRKVLTSGKQGENGMRPNSSGSYSSPNDTINDTVKILEEILKDTGEQTKYSIGIECNANNYYNDTTKKYDMDGFKQPIDTDQLLEFYLKYLTDHPAITYLEDPIADLELDGWRKIKVNIKFNIISYNFRLNLHQNQM